MQSIVKLALVPADAAEYSSVKDALHRECTHKVSGGCLLACVPAVKARHLAAPVPFPAIDLASSTVTPAVFAPKL